MKGVTCKCKYRFDAIQINDRITINVYVSVKNVMYVKKIIFGIQLHVVAKMKNI